MFGTRYGLSVGTCGIPYMGDFGDSYGHIFSSVLINLSTFWVLTDFVDDKSLYREHTSNPQNLKLDLEGDIN